MEIKGIECDVCGCPATRYIGNATLPVCDNIVCWTTRVEEVNAEIKEMLASENDEEVEV
jgi:uncharacterized Zn finger protein (UPF0148 family)